ncbi:putative procollagen-lysine,2-oxoglutarate 5-dioxygenase [Cotonvirus japonicus]|uniref:Procollagen-lysine,2-oxoglutarate 5-dioxygenase n=1 Tax=Cotonvirus japonicus TaxID=2811091 RepID=A0ABM7NS39_9VIRU|nr:putative procollagen-lysine,2-oxoglutarate 5-dioxygenase [Cotonvirus japonicus]BCS82975.1 putative procollagen-lysine,2-oxoglutarate 5-dioxygenase [Cotonvirus japonicus]
MLNKIFIINLARRSDKKLRIINEFEKLKTLGTELDYEFFDAIDGNNSQQISQFKFKIPNWIDPNSGKPMTNGEVGCALSHYSVWCKVVDLVESGKLTADCRVLILEDDVIFNDDFMKKYETYMNEINFDFDLIYLHRKPLNQFTETIMTSHIIKPNKSYWACAYLITYQCAKKLLSVDYLNNLIPVDEFIPAMHGCNIFGYEKLFDRADKITCFAVQPSLLRLTGDAFNDSETFHSGSYITNDKFIFDTDKSFNIIYIGPNKGDAYNRFIDYCKLYLLPHTILEAGKDSDMIILANYFNSINDIDLQNTLTLVISVDINDYCNVIPLVSPTEFVEKYKSLSGNQIVTPLLDNTSNKTLMLGWGNLIKDFILTYQEKINYTENSDTPLISLSTILMLDSITGNSSCMEDSKQLIFHQIIQFSDLEFNTRTSRISNKNSNNPCIFYANTPSSIITLNSVENYTGNGWNEFYGYKVTPVVRPSLPKIYMSVRTSNNPNNLKIIETIDYPRELLTITTNKNNNHTFYETDVKKFLETDSEYYFNIDVNYVLTLPTVLKELLDLNREFVTPLMRKGRESWTNYWGDIDDNGFYKRSHDYFDIINRIRTGCWNVPYVTGIYLIKRSIIEQNPGLFTDNSNKWSNDNIDMRVCHNLREKNVFMYLSNMNHYGHIEDEPVIDPTVDLSKEVTIFDLLTRRNEWERKYLHPEYYVNKNNLAQLRCDELCTDIYNFPLFSRTFCQELIKVMEDHGEWSKGQGNHVDHRLGNNYYENVPTQDIHLFQVGLEKQWDFIVTTYIAPLVKIIFNNYRTKGVHLAFVVRYHWQQQSELADHHDASNYTVNIALNEGGGKDYENGGTFYNKRNYAVKNQEIGTVVLHGGKINMSHRGLKTTAGIRYILVSFIE